MSSGALQRIMEWEAHARASARPKDNQSLLTLIDSR
jgi:hypothetical protein